MPIVEDVSGTIVVKVKERGPQGTKGEDGSGGGIPSGPTLPATPSDGDMFWHTPTGREILYKWSATEVKWIPLLLNDEVAANTEIFVDGTLGTDDLEQGTGTGVNACATISYVLSTMLPGESTAEGIVYIRVGPGTVDESSYDFNNNAGLVLQISGEKTDILTNQTSTSTDVGSVTMTGAGWTPDEYKGKFINQGSVLSNIGYMYPIVSNTEDTLYFAPGAFSGGFSTFGIHDVPTIDGDISGFYCSAEYVTISDFKLTGNSNFGYALQVFANQITATRLVIEGQHFNSRGVYLSSEHSANLNNSFVELLTSLQLAVILNGSNTYFTNDVVERSAKDGAWLLSAGGNRNYLNGSKLYGGGVNFSAGAAADIVATVFEEAEDAIIADIGRTALAVENTTYINCDREVVDYGNRGMAYSEGKNILSFVSGPPDTLTLDVDKCMNVLYATLSANSEITTTGTEVPDKTITIWVTHTGGPWTLSWNTIDLELEGAAGETESVMLVWNGANWIVNRGGVTDLTI